MKYFLLLMTIMISINTAQAIGIGFIQIKPDGAVYLHTDETITKNTPIYIQTPSKNAEMICCQKLKGSDFSKVSDSDVVTSDTTTVKMYVLSKDIISTKDELNVGVSVIGANKVIVKKNLIYAINKKSRFFIHRCFGIEGVNLLMSQTTKFKKPIKSMYYSLGYDIEYNSYSCK